MAWEEVKKEQSVKTPKPAITYLGDRSGSRLWSLPSPLLCPLLLGRGWAASSPCWPHCRQRIVHFLSGSQSLGFSSGTPWGKDTGAMCLRHGVFSGALTPPRTYNTPQPCRHRVCWGHYQEHTWAWGVDPLFPTRPWGHPHLFKTISMGTPGLTMATFIDSLPRSTDITASVSEGETDLSISPSFPAFYHFPWRR